MGIGVSLFLLAVGAVLKFAVTGTVSGIEISTVGVILMIVGGVGLLISLAMVAQERRRVSTTIVETPVVPVTRRDTTY
jgi:Domain of unknown function (DUF6458)